MNAKQIKSMAGTTTYHRGYDIWQSDGVLDFTVELYEKELLEEIHAKVQGSGRKKYQVNLTYDTEEDEISYYYCECPAYYSYDGPCKHCVAAALEYLDYKERQTLIAQYTGQSEPMRLQQDHQPKSLQDYQLVQPAKRTGSGYSPAVKQEPDTTPLMKSLLQKHAMRRSIPIVQKDIQARVCMEPALHIEREGISLDFKVGIEHKYVVKDVFEFAWRITENAEFSYGQKLKFIHDINAFEPESRPLVQFVLNWVQNNRERYLQTRYYGYYYQNSLPKLRSIPLKTDELEHFFEAVENREFTANIDGSGEGKWRLAEGELLPEVHICGKGNGIVISLDRLPCTVTDHYFVFYQQGLIYRIDREKLEQAQDVLVCLENLPDGKAYIQKADAAIFCRELLPVLERYFRCSYEEFSKENYGVEEASFEIYLDAPQKDFVTCQVKAVYGEKKYNVYGEQKADAGRDIVKEMEIGARVGEYCNAYDAESACMVLADDEEKLYELLTAGVAEFQTLGEVFISDALKRVRIAPPPKVEVGVSLSGDLLELTMTAEDMSMDQLQEILSKYNRRKKYYRLKNGDFVNMESENLGALLELKDGLGLADAQIGSGRAVVPKYRALYLDEESKEWGSLPLTKNREFRSLVRNMKTVEDNDFELPESLQNILREYQKTGFLWLKTMKHNGFGGILADDMGLGKTLQVIAFLLSEYTETEAEKRKPVLVVCPASLVFNWSSELEHFAPELPVKMVVGTAGERREILQTAENGDILLTSYDLLKRDAEVYTGMEFSCQVIDEAQYIKNHGTQAAKAVKAVQAGFKLALTGTPIENRLSELWSIFDYLMPGFLYAYQQFKSTFEKPIVEGEEEAAGKRLQKMIRPFVLRRLKKDVLKDLPDKLEENMYVRLEGEQQKLYDAHVKRLTLMLDKNTDEEFRKNKIQVLAELTRLRQLCCDPSLVYEDYKGGSAKQELCIDVIKNAVNGGHKILLFSQFTTMLANLCGCLSQEGIPYYLLTGATSKEQRRNLVEAFQRDDTPVFCISLKAGGTGLNLTAADIVIHYDPWWNLAVQNQATDRVHRIGQQNVVNVFKLIAKNTIEEKIVQLQEKKKELAEQLLNGEGMDSAGFSREELLELLGSAK